MKYEKLKSGLIIPEQRKDNPEREMAKSWNCPHCDRFFDTEVESIGEEATIGRITLPGYEYKPYIPHSNCPGCKKCMGCAKEQ